MAAELDLDDVAAGNPKAERELARLRARAEQAEDEIEVEERSRRGFRGPLSPCARWQAESLGILSSNEDD